MKVKFGADVLLVFVIALLVLAFVPYFFDDHSDTKVWKAKIDINGIGESLEMFKRDHGTFPTTDVGLDALVNNVGKTYVERVPKDPWGRSYRYRYPGEHNLNSYDIWSYGKDNQSGGTGENADVTNWH